MADLSAVPRRRPGARSGAGLGPGLRRGAELFPPPRQPPGRFRPFAPLAPPAPQPRLEIDVVAAEPALGQKDRDLGGGPAPAAHSGLHQHVREPRRHGQSGDRLAVGGRAAVFAQGSKRHEPAARLVDRGGGGRVEPAKRARIGHAPQRAVEEQGAEIGFQDFGGIEARKARRRRFLPEPVDQARPLPPGAARPLGGGGAAGAFGDQAGDPGRTVVAGTAGEAGIDDDAHAVQGEAGLRDRGRQHDLAPARRRSGDGRALGRRFQAAVKAVQVDPGRQPLEPLGGALDLGHSGKESEQAALGFAQGAADGGRHLVLDPLLRRAAEVAKLDRETPALALDDGRGRLPCAHQPGEALAVQGRRHGDEAKVGPERRLGVERQSESEVAVEAPLMDLVEQNGRDSGQLRIGLDPIPENALGEDQDPGPRRPLRVEPGRITDRLPDPLPRHLRHPLRGGPGGEAAWREEQDLAGAPALGDEGRGDGGRLARAGRGHEDGVGRVAQGGEEVGKDRVDWEFRHCERSEAIQSRVGGRRCHWIAASLRSSQ